MFTLAHFTDPHIGPMPPARLPELLGKRLTGYLSWRGNRVHIHAMSVLDALVQDIRAHEPDHIALTGDIINISLPAEYRQAADWLAQVAPPERLSLVPGNHDRYVRTRASRSLELWRPWMRSNEVATAARLAPEADASPAGFPYVRLFGKVAIIGVSSAVVTPPFVAAGRLGARQRRNLERVLQQLKQDGCFRILLIHHPPLPGQNQKRKALTDREQMQEILRETGAELVLHGHNHRPMLTMLEGRHGPVPVVGGRSASAVPIPRRPYGAGYNLFYISRKNGRWRCGSRAFVLVHPPQKGHSSRFEEAGELFPPLVFS
jgi:3',5'-cyclic AMP phosphodiesterase CpdA